MVQSFDAAYIDRLRNREPETEQHFVSYFTDLILIKLRARSLSRQIADDIKQETFLRVFRTVRSPQGIRQPERLGAFVNSVCNNVLREFLRSKGRHPTAAVDSMAQMEDDSRGSDDYLITEERKAQVRRIVDGLPARDRRVLKAIFLEERDRDEVCAQMGVEREYLRVLLHRAKTAFKSGFLKHQASLGPGPFGSLRRAHAAEEC
jgi:RNA polymerase sigma-70 factor (ECF subfamily)